MTRTLHLAWAVLRPRRAVPGQTIHSPSLTRLRVHLGDLDLYRHVNNQRWQILHYQGGQSTNSIPPSGRNRRART